MLVSKIIRASTKWTELKPSLFILQCARKMNIFSLLFFYILDFLLKQFLSDTWDKLLFFICISCSIFYHFYVMWNFVPRYECCIWVMKTSNRRNIKVKKCKCGQKLFNQMLHELGNIYQRNFFYCVRLLTLNNFCIYFTFLICKIYNYRLTSITL